MARPVVSLLTDFGPDAAAAICRGVILGIAPDAQVIDISHSVAKYQVRDGAFLLWCALPWMPVGVHVAVVDPGVGTARRPLGVRVARGDILLGPDNGLLVPAMRRLGGAVEVRELGEPRLWLATTSSTFHGRDIFAPVAGRLATGTSFEAVGPVIDQGSMTDLAITSAVARDGGLDSAVVYIDSFGNARLAGDRVDLAAVVGLLEPGRRLDLVIDPVGRTSATRVSVPWARTFGEVPEGAPLLYEDSFGRLAVADNQGDIARRLGLTRDRRIRIEPA